MKRLVLCVAGLLTMAAVGNAFGADTNDAVAWGEPSNGLQAGLSLKSTSMEPKPSATFVLTVRNVGKKPVRILNVSSYVQHYGIHLEIRSAGTNMPSIYPKFKKSSPPETDYITLNAGDADSTEVTLKLEDWKLSPPFDAEVVFVFKSDLRERSFPVNAEQDRGQSKTVAGLWTGEARSKAVSMKMATEGDKKAVVLPARNAQASTHCSDSDSADLEARAKEVAVKVLAVWVQKNPVDAQQISGASISAVKQEDDGYHIILEKDISIRDERGNVQSEGLHIAYFHVFLDKTLHVIKVKRGPDTCR